MARPKKLQEEEILPPTERVQAPVHYSPPPPQAPRVMRIEREGAMSEPVSRRFPQIRAGTCEFCGVMDPNQPAQYQYKLCPHYRGMQARCTYCPENKNPDEVVLHETLNVAEHPDKPGVLIMWCGSYECSRAHEKRFKRSVG